MKPEAAIQIAFFDQLRRFGGEDVLALSIPNEAKRSKWAGDHMKKLGLTPGAADVIALWRGGGMFIEFKAQQGRQTAAQKSFEKRCEWICWPYVICRSWEEAFFALDAEGAPIDHILSEDGSRLIRNPDVVEVEFRGIIS